MVYLNQFINNMYFCINMFKDYYIETNIRNNGFINMYLVCFVYVFCVVYAVHNLTVIYNNH